MATGIHYLDAHLHLQDERLRPELDHIVAELRRLGIRRWVVNATRESDWPAVTRLAAAHPEVLPAYGLHPWFIAERGEHWEKNLTSLLTHPESRAIAVGEIGLDKWIRPHRIDEQEDLFRRQLRLAATLRLPAVIHCLRAWGRLLDVLRSEPLPDRGFLLHSFAGPAEMVDELVALGAYFSFSGHFLHLRKAAVIETYRRLPRERLLVETDAPDMLPPDSRITHPLRDPAGQVINHPANLIAIYTDLARALDTPLETLAARVAENFTRLYGVA